MLKETRISKLACAKAQYLNSTAEFTAFIFQAAAIHSAEFVESAWAGRNPEITFFMEQHRLSCK